MDEMITLITDDGEEIELAIIDETRINNINYLLVTDVEDDEQAYILKDLSKDSDEEAEYEFVENEEELNYVGKIFEELLEDVDIEF